MLLALGVFGLRIVYMWALMVSFLSVTVTREQGQYWDASSDVLAYVLGQFVMVSPIRTTFCQPYIDSAPITVATLLSMGDTTMPCAHLLVAAVFI